MNKFIYLLLTLPFLISSPQANAQTCGVFHKKVSAQCVKFDVPKNAHLTYSGNSWDCNRGFKISPDHSSCEEIRIPDNASANLIGSFYCNSGFKQSMRSGDLKQVGDRCEKVPDVTSGKFFEFGSDFYCNSGYLKNEEARSCERITISANAFVDTSSLDGWNCFSGYIKEGSECKKFDLPEHGFWFNDYWGCEPGFKKSSDAKSCEKIFIPENAHASDTFDGWLCNSGYTKNYRDNRCDKE